MKSFLVPAALAMSVLVAGSTFADAASRNTSTTGPNGRTIHKQGNIVCLKGVCQSSQTVTGANGQIYTRSGSTTCSNGSCNGSATYSGPRGRTLKRLRSTSP